MRSWGSFSTWICDHKNVLRLHYLAWFDICFLNLHVWNFLLRCFKLLIFIPLSAILQCIFLSSTLLSGSPAQANVGFLNPNELLNFHCFSCFKRFDSPSGLESLMPYYRMLASLDLYQHHALHLGYPYRSTRQVLIGALYGYEWIWHLKYNNRLH